MKKLSAVIVVLVVVIVALWLVLRDDGGPEDSSATDSEPPVSDSAAPEADGVTLADEDESQDGDASAADQNAVTAAVDDEAPDAGDVAAVSATGAVDHAGVATDGDADVAAGNDATMTVTGSDDEDAAAQDDVGPDFDVVRVEASGDAVIAGVAEPGAAVVVTSGNNVVGETVADESGSWVIVTETPLDPGAHTLSVESESADGEMTQSGTVVVVSVPQESAQGETGEVLTVMMNDEDSGEIKVLQGADDGIGISGGGQLTLDSLSYDGDGNVSMGGHATAGGVIIVYVDGAVAGAADVEDGEWFIALEEPVDEGSHSLRVDEVSEAGAVVARLETPFVRSVFIMPEASDQLVVIQPGNSLWRIARRSLGSGVLFTLIYEANREQIADPDVIYPGQIFVVPRDIVVEH